jgi:type IV pilus assembly protein PilN
MSVRINLLPHREAKRERRKKLFYALWGLSAVAGGVLVLLVGTVLNGFIANQQERNDFIGNENRKLDAQIKEIASLRTEIDALRARQRAVEDLQADRNQPVYLFDELTKQTPEGIYLRTIKQEDRKVSVTGWAASNERVSEFLRNLQNNGRFVEKPELAEIKIATAQGAANVQRRLFEFSLSFVMRPTPERAQLVSGRSSAPPPPAAAPASAPAAAAAPKK